MKEIVVISGKGGTGKTSLTASFAMLGGSRITVADCDVDAADMHLLLKPDFARSEDFFSGYLAEIDKGACTQCGICKDICRFNAISIEKDSYTVNPWECEGCGYCYEICPDDAINFEKRLSGDLYISETKAGNYMAHARLGAGAENSGKLVAKVKSEAQKLAAKNGNDLILVDGPPGIGCPVISSLSGASFAVYVTEPTLSGMHDLERVHKLAQKFGVKSGCIINKYDINLDMTSKIEEYARKENILILSKIPFDDNFTRAMTFGKTIVEYDSGRLKEIIEKTWKKILEINERPYGIIVETIGIKRS